MISEVDQMKVQHLLGTKNHIKGDKLLILSLSCRRDLLRRVFFVEEVDEKGRATVLRHIKYYYHDAISNGIDGITRIKNKDLGIIKLNQIDSIRCINAINVINTYLNEGYVICDE